VAPGRQSAWAGAAGQFGRNLSGRGHAGRGMGKLTIWFVVVIVLAAIGGAFYLALWNPPVPSAAVEKVLPDARFPK